MSIKCSLIGWKSFAYAYKNGSPPDTIKIVNHSYNHNVVSEASGTLYVSRKKEKNKTPTDLITQEMANLFSYDAALGYKQVSRSVQKVDGQMFIEKEVCPQPGDAILDLGCGTGELSAYLAELVGPEGKVVGVDPDKERILLAQQCYSEVKKLSFVEGNASNFPGIGSESYDIIFSNYVIHWISDKQQLFKNMFKGLNPEGKIAIQYSD